MAKRLSQSADGAAAFRKRQRLTHDVPSGEDVTSSEQLKQLLTLDQNMRNARNGLFSHKGVYISLFHITDSPIL
jgi:nucleolar pre-ribosomal-associated protein 1